MRQNLRRHAATLLLLGLGAALLAGVSRHILTRPATTDSDDEQQPQTVRTDSEGHGPTTVKPQAEVSAQLLREMVHSRTAIVVDARLHSLYRQEHIPGAMNIPALRPGDDALREVLAYPRHVTIVVYCESENCTDSKSVAALLREEGMRDVRALQGGIEQWRTLGFPVVAGE